MNDGVVAGSMLVMIVILVIIVGVYASRVRHAGPNRVLVISGMKPEGADPDEVALRVLIGPGRSFIFPVIERCDELSLEIISSDFRLADVTTQDQRYVNLTGTVQFHIGQDPGSILNAAVHLLSKSEEEIARIVTELLEKHTRVVAESMPAAAIQSSPIRFADAVQEGVVPGMHDLGLVLVSLVVKKVS